MKGNLEKVDWKMMMRKKVEVKRNTDVREVQLIRQAIEGRSKPGPSGDLPWQPLIY